MLRDQAQMCPVVIGLRHALFALALVLANAMAGIGATWWGVQGMLGMTGVLLAVLGLGGFVVPSARMVTDAGSVADRERGSA